MNTESCVDFCWNDLLSYMAKKRVVPVIGEGLYWVRKKSNRQAGDFLLYPYLAKLFIKEMGLDKQISNEIEETFSLAVFRSQEQNPGKDIGNSVDDFLSEQLNHLTPIPNGPLWKLARMKNLGLFINTTHDNYLERILKRVRNHPVETIHYSIRKKWTNEIERTLFKKLEAGQCSIIFNIYGNATRSIEPAYTEKDILETIVSFQEDIYNDPNNVFFQTLQSSHLLFLGCRYDDWLFRFFIRTMSNKEFSMQKGAFNRQFIGDDFNTFRCGDLWRFLKAHSSEVFYSERNVALVDTLFEKNFPDHVIRRKEFPRQIFLSFHGQDRETVICLAKHLREDGIHVWLDQWELSCGENVDRTIVEAIATRPIFIPIVSHATHELLSGNDNTLKYHIKEWEWAYSNHIKGEKPIHILPVIIDDTKWMYDSFKQLVHLKIPGGQRTGDYERLRLGLLEIIEQLEG